MISLKNIVFLIQLDASVQFSFIYICAKWQKNNAIHLEVEPL